MKSQFIRQCNSARWSLPTDRRQSGRGQPHSKTLSRQIAPQSFREVLECGCPLPLSYFSLARVLFTVLMVVHSSLAASTNDLATALQKGLFEEEANHNFPAAIEAYQSVINRFDEDRKLAATAIFRVGEIYRKQGKTNEANAQYERVVREFSDQSTLATLSQSYLAASSPLSVNAATTNVNSESAPTSDEAEEVRKIRAMIRDSPDLVNATDQGGLTRLHTAASQGHLIVAQFLIENKADVNAKTRFGGNTPVYIAAREGHKAFVELLLSHGGSVQIADSIGGTPLHAAAQKGFRSIVEVLLAHGADVNAKTKSGSTPLHLAVASGFKSVTELLLGHGAEVNPQTSDARDQAQAHAFNGTPLHIAVDRDDQPLAELLLAHKADPNSTNTAGDTPLHVTSREGAQKLMELLLANKAVVDPINTNGETPLDLSAINGHSATAALLLSNGANVNAANPVPKGLEGYTPLMYAINSRRKGIVNLLLQNKANPNLPARSVGSGGSKGFSPLLVAVWQRDADIIVALLEAKADPNLKIGSGLTPARATMSYSDPVERRRVLSLLLDHEADTEDKDDYGSTLLMLAIQQQDKETVELLLAHKANVNAKTPSGATPLHIVATAAQQASYENLSAIVELLLAAGADINAQNNAGQTPLNYLLGLSQPGVPQPFSQASSTKPKIAELLRSHGAVLNPPRLDTIEVRRADANYSKVIFTKGTNGWDQFTLFELIAVEYHSLTALPAGESRPTKYLDPRRDKGLGFPDFTRIRIRHPKPDFKNWSERTVNVAGALTSGDCSADVPLELGDQVEIPEADHVLGAEWEGLSNEVVETLKKCLTRRVSIVLKGQSKVISIAPGISPQEGDLNKEVIAPFMIRPVLLNSKLLLASSDLSRIKLVRADANGQKRELIVDCTSNGRPPSVWLRDGDVIEVPDKP